ARGPRSTATSCPTACTSPRPVGRTSTRSTSRESAARCSAPPHHPEEDHHDGRLRLPGRLSRVIILLLTTRRPDDISPLPYVPSRLSTPARGPPPLRAGGTEEALAMQALALAAFRSTPLTRQPFPYLVVPGFIRAAARAAINADYPRIDHPGSFP